MGIKAKEVKAENPVVSLAFRVVPMGEGLYAPQMLMLMDDIVVNKRTGIGTTLGHAIAAADDLVDGWAFSEIETKAQDFYDLVLM